MTGATLERVLQMIGAAAMDGTLVKVTLSAPRARDAEVRQILLRPVALRAGQRLACVWRHRRRDVSKNLEVDAALELVHDALQAEFAAAHVFTTTATAHYEDRPPRRPHLHLGPPQHDAPPSLAHDRVKHRALLPPARSWLAALGVTSAEGKVKKGMEGKLRQVDKFVEILAHHLPPELRAPRPQPLRVVDMGAGKGYLTFAAAAWLQQEGIAAEVYGVEARDDLVEQANAAARAHDLPQLRFEVDTIAARPLGAVDVVLALHACDTATDDALAQGIAASASLLVASPCCHKELRPQLDGPAGLAPVLRHGILRERQAEIVTDALRAALLGAAGYATDVFEFVATEHSAKNLLLVATRRAGVDRAAAAQAARALAQAFGVRQQRLAHSLGIALAE